MASFAAAGGATKAAAAVSAAGRRYILGRGCDPARAAFAKQQWEPILGNVDIDTATSDGELSALLTQGRKVDVFFIAPGMLSLIRSGRVDGEAMKALVKQHQPGVQIVELAEPGKAIPLLTQALGAAAGEAWQPQGAVPMVRPLTKAWPFAD